MSLHSGNLNSTQKDNNGSNVRRQQMYDRSPVRTSSKTVSGYQGDPSPSKRQQQLNQQIMYQDYNDDNLEYFIKFPIPNIQHEDNEDFVFVHNEPNVPVVLLLGWAGCQDRYLMKYSKIYEDRGLITIRYTAPVETLFWKRSAMLPIGEKILKLLHDMNFDNHPLIFHVFSNGGAYLYQHISVAIKKSNRPIHIRGMIFDSAPGDRRIMSLYRAMATIYGRKFKNRCFSCLIAWTITLTLTLMWCTEETYIAFKSLFKKVEGAPQTKPFHDLKTEYTNFPQLFLYSKSDTVIPYQDIEHFADFRQKQRGVDVTKICFDNAEHVRIYIKYPQQYIRCLCAFINNCLNLFKGVSKID